MDFYSLFYLLRCATSLYNLPLVKKFEFVGSKADNYRFLEDDSDPVIDIDTAINTYIHSLNFNDDDYVLNDFD